MLLETGKKFSFRNPEADRYQTETILYIQLKI